MSTEKLVFIDLLNFSPIQTKLRNFLSFFPLNGLKKLHFPYLRLKSRISLKLSLSKLKRSDFRANLGDMRSELSADYRTYCSLMKHVGVKGEGEVLRRMNLDNRPSNSYMAFWELRRRWEEDGLETLGDLLTVYAVADASPLLLSIRCLIYEFHKHVQLGYLLRCFIR